MRLRNAGKGRAVFDGELTVNKQIAALVLQLGGIGRHTALVPRREHICHKQLVTCSDLCVGSRFYRHSRAGQDHCVGANGKGAALLNHIEAERNRHHHVCCVELNYLRAVLVFKLHGFEVQVALERKGRLSDVDAGDRRRSCGIVADRDPRIGRGLEQRIAVGADGFHRGQILDGTRIDHCIAVQLRVVRQNRFALDVHDRVAVERAGTRCYATDGYGSAVIVRHNQGLIHCAAVHIHCAAGDIACVAQDCSAVDLDACRANHPDRAVAPGGAAADGLIPAKRAAHNQFRTVIQRQLRIVQRQHAGKILLNTHNPVAAGCDLLIGIGVLCVGVVDRLLAGSVGQQKRHIVRNCQILALLDTLQQNDHVADSGLGRVDSVFQIFIIVVADLCDRIEVQLEVCLQRHIVLELEGIICFCRDGFTVYGPLVENVADVARFGTYGDLRIVVRLVRRCGCCTVSVGLDRYGVPVDCPSRVDSQVFRGHRIRYVLPAAEGIAFLDRRLGKRDRLPIRDLNRLAVLFAVHHEGNRVHVRRPLCVQGAVAVKRRRIPRQLLAAACRVLGPSGEAVALSRECVVGQIHRSADSS